jgi:hypothetical protein
VTPAKETAVSIVFQSWIGSFVTGMIPKWLAGSGTDRQIGASFDRFERAISAVLMLAFSSEANF